MQVTGTSANSVPYSQSFESASSFPGNDAFIINPDDGTTWVRSTAAGSSGTASIMIHNYNGNVAGQTDAYITEAFDLTYITQPSLTFKVANAQGNANTSDRLKVYLSADCGYTWVPRYNKAGAQLATAGALGTNFIPNSSQWRLETINMSLFTGKPNVRVIFENTSDAGNNTYIDDINITGTVGVNEVNPAVFNFDIYPNPSHGESVVSFELSKESNTHMHIRDMMGREVNELANTRLQAGLHQFNVSRADFAKGIYFVELVIDGNRSVKKMIVD